MELSILLIIIGIVLAILVNYILGIIVILIGLAMLLLPRLGARRVRWCGRARISVAETAPDVPDKLARWPRGSCL